MDVGYLPPRRRHQIMHRQANQRLHLELQQSVRPGNCCRQQVKPKSPSAMKECRSPSRTSRKFSVRSQATRRSNCSLLSRSPGEHRSCSPQAVTCTEHGLLRRSPFIQGRKPTSLQTVFQDCLHSCKQSKKQCIDISIWCGMLRWRHDNDPPALTVIVSIITHAPNKEKI